MVSKSPTHYTIGNIEVWDFIRDQGMNYHRGNAIKYICRAGYKSTGTTNGIGNRTMQLGLIVEEFEEFTYAYHHEGYEQELKELADVVYVAFQYAENMEWDLEEALRRVHKSNMSKLGLDGKPIRRADGKVLKGPKYQPPHLTDLVS